MKKILIFFCVIGLYILNFTYCYADDDLVLKIQKYYEQQNSFTSKFSQQLIHKESGAKENRTGILDFQKPLRVFWKTEKPAETLIVTDKEIWQYIVDEELVYKYSADLIKDSRNIIQVITGQALLTKDFDYQLEGLDKNYQKLRLYPKEPNTQMVEVLLWVNPQTGHINTARVLDFYGNINEITFTSYTVNKKFDKSHFQFTVPKGVELEDRTNGNIQRDLFK